MENENKIKILQTAELKMFKEIVKVCEKYNLTYFMSAGTFLGAVRHQGFIPWDEDMDMRMPRADYEKLIEVLHDELSYPYTCATYTRDSNVHRYFARVENKCVRFQRVNTKIHQKSNVWIDIFPLDGMPSNKVRRKIREWHLLYRKMWMHLSVFDEIVDLKQDRPWYEKIIVFLALNTPIQRMISWDKAVRNLDRALKAYPLEKSEYYMNFMSSYKFKDIIPKTVYGNGKMYKFEDAEFLGPEDYDTFLKALYGDYMKLPPVEKRCKQGIDYDSIEVLE